MKAMVEKKFTTNCCGAFPFLPPNAGFPRVESERGTGDGKRRGDKWHLSVAFPRPKESAIGGGFIPPPLSCLGIGFWYKFVPPSNGCSAFYQYPFSPPKTVKKRRRSSAPLPQKILRKIFRKVTISVIFSVL